MNYKELEQEMNSGNLKSVYLFTGDEEHLMNIYIEKLKNSIISKEMETLNYTEIEGKDSDFEDVLNACETLPFMADKKMVYVKDLMELIDNNKDFSDSLNEYLPKIADYTVLILRDKANKLRRNTRLYRTINTLNGVVDFKRFKNNELVAWIRNLFKKHGKQISNQDLNYLIQKSNYMEYRSEKTLNEFSNELEKIISHSEEEFITKIDIESNFTETLDTNIFNLLDNINRKNTENSLRIFNEMYMANEPIQRILFMIIRQLRLILKYKIFRSKGYNDVQTRNKLGVKPYEYSKISGNARVYTEDEVQRHLEYILEIDKKQKTSYQNDKLALETLIVKLTK